MSLPWHQEARELRAAGEKQQAIADRFGVTQACVSRVVAGIVCPVNHRAEHLKKVRYNGGSVDKWAASADAFILKHYGPWPASRIGKHLGVSRNAIIGRVWRLRQREAAKAAA